MSLADLSHIWECEAMIDLLTIFDGKFEQTFVGTHYPKMPNEEINGTKFDYEFIDMQSKQYQMMFANVSASDSITTAIKTKDALGWKISDYISLQDGTFYTIIQIQKDNQSGNKLQGRYLADLTGIDYIVRLQEHDNIFGLN